MPLSLRDLLLGLLLFVAGIAQANGLDQHARQLEILQRHAALSQRRSVQKRDSGAGVKNITFSNSRASEFYVDGTAIPDVPFDIGPSWSGLIPISGSPNETRKLFFWFFPPGPQGSLDDLIFWTNGGPGCSSLQGLLEENGPISWPSGRAAPSVNDYSWTNLSSILYVEQPIGTGFSQGVPTAANEVDLAAQLVGFFYQFLEIFNELKGKNFYLAGESYAGAYIPYVADYIYNSATDLDLNLQGTWIGDPYISWLVVQQQIPAYKFVRMNENVFGFNRSFMNHLSECSAQCGYSDYVQKFATYPPRGMLPLPGDSTIAAEGCDLWSEIYYAAMLLNPAFNIYRVFDQWPMPTDVLLTPVNGLPPYFDRADVKKAINVPLNITWTLCSLFQNVSVFPNGDASLPSTFSALARVIEKNQRSVIVHGLADFILIAEGTRIAIQNMTWNGLQGFQTPIEPETFIVDGVGAFGNWHSERGLSYYEVALSGHLVPEYQPQAAFQTMQYLMGFRDDP